MSSLTDSKNKQRVYQQKTERYFCILRTQKSCHLSEIHIYFRCFEVIALNIKDQFFPNIVNLKS